LPTIATACSGLTAFHNARVGFLLPYRLMPVSPQGAAEIPLYAGHCWAEPDMAALRRLMREVVEDPSTAASIGLAARHTIAHQCSRPPVTALLREELARCRGLGATGKAEHEREREHEHEPAPGTQRPP